MQPITFQPPDAADAPPGQEGAVAGTSPVFNVSKDTWEEHRESGEVMFVSRIRMYRLPIVPRIEKVENGRRVIVDHGHAIQFRHCVFWADDCRKIDTPKFGKQTEAGFLRKCLEEQRRRGGTYPFREVTEDDFKGFSTKEASSVELLERVSRETLLTMFFDESEVTQHNLREASHERIILTIMKLKKPVPDELLEGVRL